MGCNTIATGWTPFTTQVMTPSVGAVSARVTLWGNGPASTWYLDDVALSSVTAGTTGIWSYPNVHGDVTVTANAAGVVTGTYSYDPYGTSLATLPDNAASDFDNGWLGTHQRPVEHGTGVVNTIEMGARPYQATLARFLSVDPIEGGTTTNDYGYVPDPVNQFDLNGQANANPCGVKLDYRYAGPGGDATWVACVTDAQSRISSQRGWWGGPALGSRCAWYCWLATGTAFAMGTLVTAGACGSAAISLGATAALCVGSAILTGAATSTVREATSTGSSGRSIACQAGVGASSSGVGAIDGWLSKVLGRVISASGSGLCGG